MFEQNFIIGNTPMIKIKYKYKEKNKKQLSSKLKSVQPPLLSDNSNNG